LRLQARPDREYLGLEDKEADDWEKLIEREFSYWAESPNCDLTRTQNFYDMQALAFLSTLMNGDAFVTLPMKKVANSPYSLRVKMYEGDQCVSPNGDDWMSINGVVGGIKLDADGAPLEYYFAKKHPGDGYTAGTFLAGEYITIPAFGKKSGRRNVLHLMLKERIGQRRGAPILAPVLEQLKQASRLSEAELMASVVNACFTVFITTPSETNPFNSGYFPGVGGTQDAPGGEGNEKILNPVERPADEKNIELGNGSVVSLAEGEKPEMASPNRPNAGFEPFFNAIMKQIGSSIGIPYEVLMLSFQSSYSASRAALLEAWKLFREWRTWMARNYCQPIYEEFLMEAVLLGRISAPGFLEDPVVRAAWSWTKWAGPGMGMIDPLKEVQASAMKIEKRLSTYEDEKVSMDGGNWDDMIQRAAREDRVLTENKLKPAPETPARAAPTNPPEDERGG
jgi:lambda family phage portal protein